ncbi:unnamed protein product [Rotaria sp. Silwood2]|nr:unnamed protein product [Rotaria sp. Silwood2]CAF4471815.1 unnamed protein product [Rotaria sp. Silwood2]
MKLCNYPKKLCYRSDGTAYVHDQLRQLQIEKVDNQSAYRNDSDASKMSYISKNYLTLAEFIENTRKAFMSRQLILGSHSHRTIFRNPPYKDMVKQSSCDGLWMEFDVFRGASLSLAATWKSTFCGNKSEPVYGLII